MRSLTGLVLLLIACRQYEVLCSDSDRCEPPPQVSPDLSSEPTHWQPVAVPANTPPLLAIRGLAESVTRIYAVGNSGTVLIGDGTAGFVKSAAVPSPAGNLTALFATETDLWVVDGSNGTVHRSTSGGASFSNTMAGALGTLQAIYAQGNNVLAVGQDTQEGRFNNGAWLGSRYPPGLRKSMYAVWAAGNNFYIAGSNAGVGRSADPGGAGQPWSDISPTSFTPNFRALWGASETNLYAAGLAGALARYNGTQWTMMNQGSSDLTAIWGSGAADIWVVGKDATVLHFDGTQWTSRSSPTLAGHHLTGVWGDSRGGIWVSATSTAGTSGAVFKY